jgi:adenosine deaminase
MNNTEEIPRHKYEELHFFLGDNPDNFRNVSEFMKATEKAALIRASLFEYLKECERNSSFVSNDNSLDKAYELYKNLDDLMILNKLTVKTTRLRFQHGFQIAEYDDAVLDYAMTSDIVRPGDENYHNRSLAGERAFLYNCFKAIFSGQLNSVYKELFYYYLIVKSRVQSEFVQSNKRYGFDNFARYTHRKLSLVPQSLQLIYRKEMVIQTLACSKHELHLKNLEIRVTPDNKTGKNIKWLSDIATWFNRYESITGSGSGYYYCWLRDTRQALSDPQDNSNSLVEWMLRSENQFNRLPNDFISVVYHFIKEVDKFDPKTGNYQSFPCRHYKLRNKIEVQAYALQQSLEYDNNRNQIRGIDAASSEVTCRPEVFASAFRFLSKLRFTFHSRIYDFSNSQRSDTLSRTFHAGEDFHDLCSGLRAMDEAVLFLGLKENDRIGHGMALGLSPVEYYTKNGGHISLPTQEMFDNIVWLICRSRELNVIIPPMVREILENKFHELLSNLTAKLVTNSDNSSSDNDIIHKSDIASFPIRDFYDAWQLRGDNPLLYMNVSALSTVPQDSPLDKYHTKNPEVLDYVRTPHARRIYNIYHYDRSFREAGKINTEFKADKNFMTFVTEIQTALLKQFEQKHIAIECCPTSNILISNFERYDNHPILHLSDVSGNYSAAKLSVSLNTDDQGVFQTDLMNEYALIASALERKTDENGERLYSSETIFEWLDRVREHSVNQMF